jgi:Ca2+-binding EF-hand superfamily protein
MMRIADQDGSGIIDFDEFCTLMKNQLKDAETGKELETAFSVFDRDGDKSISREELSYIMTHCGGDKKLSAEELDQMMNIVDEDKDGQISWEEFVDMMKQKIKIK